MHRSEESRVEAVVHLIWGRRAIAEVLKASPGRVRSIRLLSTADISPELREQIEAQRVRPVPATREELDLLSSGGVHQGIVCELSPPSIISLSELVGISKNGSQLIVVLDQVTDPHNLGAVLRVAEGCGVDGVVITKDRSAGLTPAARKASAGASELLPLVSVPNLARALEELKDSGYWIYGAALTEASASIYGVEFNSPTVLVFGSEGEGLRRLTIEHCDLLFSLPMRGAIGSLNVSQAVTATLYEVVRRREG